MYCCTVGRGVVLRKSKVLMTTPGANRGTKMFFHATALLLASAASALVLTPPPCYQISAPAIASRAAPLRLQMRDDDEELDALDGCDDWDQAMKEQEQWMAEQKAKKESYGGSFGKASLQSDDDGPLEVDESAWFDEPDDEETPAEMAKRQMAEKQAAEMLARIQAAAPTAPDNSKVMTSLESVLTMMMRLEAKVDNLTTLVEKLRKETPVLKDTPTPPPAAAAAPKAEDETPAEPTKKPLPPPVTDEWDGTVDEGAWFDDDPDEDFADWREVRRLKKLLELDAEKPEDPPKE